MTKKELLQTPRRKDTFGKSVSWFDTFVIIPGGSRNIHDSGYRCMTYVAVKKNRAIFLFGYLYFNYCALSYGIIEYLASFVHFFIRYGLFFL